jgi:hypothetical protein
MVTPVISRLVDNISEHDTVKALKSDHIGDGVFGLCGEVGLFRRLKTY